MYISKPINSSPLRNSIIFAIEIKRLVELTARARIREYIATKIGSLPRNTNAEGPAKRRSERKVPNELWVNVKESHVRMSIYLYMIVSRHKSPTASFHYIHYSNGNNRRSKIGSTARCTCRARAFPSRVCTMPRRADLYPCSREFIYEADSS